MLRKEYWISELAELTGVSTRTIRYYIKEGLLPQPEIRGKYAVFTDEYMHRLRLIKLLKDAYLPLNRINELLNTLTYNEIVSLLNEFAKDPVIALAGLQSMPNFAQQSGERSTGPGMIKNNEQNLNALEYIQNLRTEKPIFEKMERNPRLDRHDQPRKYAFDASLVPGSEWRRIKLAPGLELHVRQPMNATRENSSMTSSNWSKIKNYLAGRYYTMQTPKLILKTDAQLISTSVPTSRALEIEFTAPEARQGSESTPLNLALVIDRSGSMADGKLEQAKLAVGQILDLMRPVDSVSIVEFDNVVNITTETDSVTPGTRLEMKNAVNQLHPRGSTDLGGGWLDRL